MEGLYKQSSILMPWESRGCDYHGCLRPLPGRLQLNGMERRLFKEIQWLSSALWGNASGGQKMCSLKVSTIRRVFSGKACHSALVDSLCSCDSSTMRAHTGCQSS